MNDQFLGAFIAALLGQDVSISQIERATKCVEQLTVGESIIQRAILDGPPILSQGSYALSEYTGSIATRLMEASHGRA